MTTNLDAKVTTQAAFQLKGGLYTLTTIKLLTNDLTMFQEQINSKIKQAPNFFYKAPVIIDLKQVNLREEYCQIDFVKLRTIIEDSDLILIGIKNANEVQQALAIQENLAILRENIPLSQKTIHTPDPVKQQLVEKISVKLQAEGTNNGNKIVTIPVRSGQQIYVPDGDLIIISSVSHGAELLADGNIHVYGALRGRALAGINGNTQTRIFCSSLEAELISIAGIFKISEDIEKQAWKVPVEIYLKEGYLQIREL
jgi:septum site-determining protein MinC